LIIFYSITFLTLGLARPQTAAPAGSGLQASNLLNPNVSVIGWFQAEAGRRNPNPRTQAIGFREAEIAFQAVVDPYARADFFLSAEEDGVGLEEGYLTWFNLPGHTAFKLGKMRAGWGKFNRTHPGETPFADRPLAHETYFGEEGLAGTGGSFSWQIPNPWLFLNLDAEALTVPSASEAPAFDTARRGDMLYVGRLNAYKDITESVNATWGASWARGAAGQSFDAVTGTSTTLVSQVYGTDLTFRWKNPRRATARSAFWQTEILWNSREQAGLPDLNTHGFFSHVEHQFLRRWRAGVRYDWSQSPALSGHAEGELAYLTFTPSEFSLISLQGRRRKMEDGTNENLGFLKVTFNIGPHGAHPF
jgi:hypothetical protein